MAEFNDITGWRAELDVLRDSDVYRQLYTPEAMCSPYPKIPLSVLLTYAELLVKNKETSESILALAEWRKNQPDIYLHPDDDPTYPFKARQLLTDFESWFVLKTGQGVNNDGYRSLGQFFLAKGVLTGRFSSVRSPEAIAEIKKEYGFPIIVWCRMVLYLLGVMRYSGRKSYCMI